MALKVEDKLRITRWSELFSSQLPTSHSVLKARCLGPPLRHSPSGLTSVVDPTIPMG